MNRITIICTNTDKGAPTPNYLTEAIEKLNNTNRVIVTASITHVLEGTTKDGEPASMLGYITASGDRGYSGWRMSIETQLIAAGIINLGLNCAQQFALREVLTTLGLSAGYGVDHEINLSKSCFKYALLGKLDQALEDGIITDAKYLPLRAKLGTIPDLFARDFEWYFGQPVPSDCYKWDEVASQFGSDHG